MKAFTSQALAPACALSRPRCRSLEEFEKEAVGLQGAAVAVAVAVTAAVAGLRADVICL